MRTNVAAKFTEKTAEGAQAHPMNAEQALRRSVMACMLWEDEFYEDGQTIAARIALLAKALPFEKVAAIAIEAREQMKLRHAPLWLVVAILKAKHQGRKVGDLIARVCQRADEPAELLSLYWKDQKDAPLPKQLKVGLARALGKFDEHQLAKYNRDGAVKLRDVLFLSHAKPHNEERAALYKRITDGTLATPDTWEVKLSAGEDKKATFLRLMAEKNLGGLAFLRNLRNMEQAGITKAQVAEHAASIKLDRVLPFRFIAAARAVPQWEEVVEPMMLRALGERQKLGGKTVLLIDTSPSMDVKLSAKSDLSRKDAAFGMAVLCRELCEDVEIWAFSQECKMAPARRGFALADAIDRAVPSNGTLLGKAIGTVSGRYDRLICVTDEQSQDAVRNPDAGKDCYLINVASAKNGVGYGQWTHIDGWSEACIDYIKQSEAAQ